MAKFLEFEKGVRILLLDPVECMDDFNKTLTINEGKIVKKVKTGKVAKTSKVGRHLRLSIPRVSKQQGKMLGQGQDSDSDIPFP